MRPVGAAKVAAAEPDTAVNVLLTHPGLELSGPIQLYTRYWLLPVPTAEAAQLPVVPVM